MQNMFLSGTDFWRYLDKAYNSVPGSGGSNPIHAIPCVHGLTSPAGANSRKAAGACRRTAFAVVAAKAGGHRARAGGDVAADIVVVVGGGGGGVAAVGWRLAPTLCTCEQNTATRGICFASVATRGVAIDATACVGASWRPDIIV
jgi:hypothetical protein